MSLELDLIYTCNLSAVEKASVLSIWKNWGETRSVDEKPILFKDKALIESKKITISVDVAAAGGEGKITLPADASLHFEILATVTNEDGEWARARGGYARMPLKVLIESFDTTNNKPGISFAVEYFNDWDADGNRTQCGTLKVTAMRYAGVERRKIEFAESSVYSFIDANADFLSKAITCAVARRIVNYTDEAAGKGKGMVPLRTVLARVQAPWYNSTAGVTCGPFYWLAPVRSSNNQIYFDEMVNNALLRHNRDAKWFHSTVDTQFSRIKSEPGFYHPEFSECVRIIGDTLCMSSVSLPYIPDTVDQRKRNLLPVNQNSQLPEHDPKSLKPSESWDCAMTRNAGDCEDLARLIHLMFQGLRYGAWKAGSLSASAARVLQLYVGAGTLGSVLAPSLGNEHQEHKPNEGPTIINSKHDTEAEVGAHMFYMLVDNKKFATQLRRTTGNMPADVAGKFSEAGWDNLPTCILEGTGRLDPFQLPLTAYVASNDAARCRQLVEKEKTRRAVIRHLLDTTKITSMMQMTRSQRQITRTANARISDFYMQPTSFVALEPMDNTNALEYMWVTVGDRVAESAGGEPFFVSANERLGESETTATDAAAEEQQGVCDIDAEEKDPWAAASAILSSPMFSALPAQSAVANESHRRRIERSLHAQFARGVKSIRGTMLNDEANAALLAAAADGGGGGGGGIIRYGIDIEDTLRSPSPAHVGILPTTSIDSVEARIGAETLRQLRPIALPGNFQPLEKIFAAEDASLAAIGINTNAGVKGADEAVEKLRAWTKQKMGGDAWPTFAQAEAKNYSLLTFFFAKKELHSSKTGEPSPVTAALMEQFGAQKQAGVIVHARLHVEVPLPRREHIALQFLCDASRMPAKK